MSYKTKTGATTDFYGEPALIPMPAAAYYLGVSRRTLERMIAAGRTPQPIRVGRRAARFHAHEFVAWVEAGAPDRTTWRTLWSGRRALRFRCSCGRRWSPSALWRFVAAFLEGTLTERAADVDRDCSEHTKVDLPQTDR